MKKIVCLALTLLFIAECSAQQKDSPIEGGWKLVYSKDADDFTFPGNYTGSDVKTWTSGTFVFAGNFKMDTAHYDNYGWGTYKLSGNRYEESITYHHLAEPLIGTTIKMLIEVKNDTLYQKWPVNDQWQLPDKYTVEKYVRIR